MDMNFVTDLFGRLAEMATGAEPWQQVGVLLLAGAIPFIESYLGSFLGVVLGISPALAVISAVVGNMISTFVLIALASGVRGVATRNRTSDTGKTPSARRQKVAKYADRVGVPGVCLLGPLLVASQITAPTLVAIGASKVSVYIWQGIAIIAWGVLFGFFGEAVVRWFI